MEHNTPKFRLRLNLFDGIVLAAALLVGGLLVWNMLKPAASPDTQAPEEGAVRYTVRFRRMLEGSSQLIQPGDILVDTIKNYNLGTVVSVETVPAQAQVLDQEERAFVMTEVEGFEDALVTVETTCTETEESILLDGGYILRVGANAYIRGAGYMGSGPIISVEREDLA